MTKAQTARKLADQGVKDPIAIIGYRSRGSKYGEYDDIGALLTPTQYLELKFNTLPSKWEGSIAKLMPGVYRYKKGLHGIHHLNLGQRKDGTYFCPEDKEILDWLSANPGKDHPPVLVNGKPRILPYWAYRQAGPVNVLRHGAANTERIVDPAGWPFIDLHKGGWNLTSSEGCQTFYPDHWNEARAVGFAAMDKYGQKEISYCLVEI